MCTHAELAASFRFLLHRKDKFWFDNVGASKQLKMHHLSIVSWIANTPKIVDIYSYNLICSVLQYSVPLVTQHMLCTMNILKSCLNTDIKMPEGNVDIPPKTASTILYSNMYRLYCTRKLHILL